jgi:hypothetical protein
MGANNSINPVNSYPINIENTPNIPIGYYSINNNTGDNSYSKLKSNLSTSCSKIGNDGIFKKIPDNLNNLNKNISNLDIPYYSTIAGTIDTNLNDKNNVTYNPENVNTQIKYLSCQLSKARNRIYDLKKFPIISNYATVENTFEKMGTSLRLPLIIIFAMTMYFLISGLFGSLDIASNIINLVQNNSEYNSVMYWIGILIGLLIPIGSIYISYLKEISTNLESLNKEDITNNPYGSINNVPTNKEKNTDYLTLLLFILVIYSFVGVLFTIKKSSFNNLIYTILIGSILLIIAILIFIMYSFIPYFNTTDKKDMSKLKGRALRLFINKYSKDETQDISEIYSNQTEDYNLRSIFIFSALAVYIFAIIFLKNYSKSNDKSEKTFFGSLIKGFLGSSAILVVPIFWVLNFIIGIQYFYIYPILLIILRFIRYIIMACLYIYTKDSPKNDFSEDLIKNLDNFKNYTPTWGFAGIDELKIISGIFGYENQFSKFIISNGNSANISDNKFISSGLLALYFNNNQTNGLFFSILYIVLTIIITSIILFGVVKV